MELISDCQKCQQRMSVQQRQAMACGFEPALPPGHSMAWSHRGGPVVKKCAGYLIRLPQVVEVVRAHHHWTKGELQSFAKSPNEQMLEGVEILDRELSALEAWRIEQSK